VLHAVIRQYLEDFLHPVVDFYTQDARQRGIPDGRPGTVTVIQRFGGGLNLNVHFHTLVFDGVFSEDDGGGLAFHPAPPSDEAVARVLDKICGRLGRLLARRGFQPGEETIDRPDRLAEESPAFASIAGASVQGRVALGARADARVRRLGHDPDTGVIVSRGPRPAHLAGFDLHANVRVPANDRARLEGLCRYVLRPPLAQNRLQLRADGRVLVTLKATWHDGTSCLLFEPVEFLEKLAALIPRPESNQLLYHGLLAPHAAWRQRVVGFARPPEAAAAAAPSGRPGAGGRPRYQTWATLMQRAFELDVLSCPRCGGRLRLIGTIGDPDVIRKILMRLDLALSPDCPGPAPPEPPDSRPTLAGADDRAPSSK
jgi:hypothetical protein